MNKITNISPLQIDGEKFFKISHSDAIRPFFMSIVSASNHWMFISSNGGLSAGRKNAEYALFPYYTDDKITEFAEITGSKSIFRIQKNGSTHVWEPFSERFDGQYNIDRNLYKNLVGNKVIFEEINHDLELSYSYQWSSSNEYGFIRTSKLSNKGSNAISVEFVDGIQNIMPYGVASDLQNAASNLVDAYKRSELQKDTGIAIYALSAIIVDKAEPSEALKANTVWSLGIDKPTYLLSSLQLKAFRKGFAIKEETDVKAEKGAYFLHSEISLDSGEEKEWLIIANLNQSQTAIAHLGNQIKTNKEIKQAILEDVAVGRNRLIELLGAADGLQLSSDHYRDARHLSNTLFNIMRGGIFDKNYQIEKWDFVDYLEKANKQVFKNEQTLLGKLATEFTLSHLKELAAESADANFKRLCLEYMPLKFSRRHGDPSRPWNKFSINTRNEIDGSKILDYEGNWRDIFQNWEALAYSYPQFIESMIHKFLNASTFDGYNPYRVTKGGFDWEESDPDDPWSYIGYWGDHQIIYLLKFLEFIENSEPGKLAGLFNKDVFVYANVPYKIKPYGDILKDPKDTIEFDHALDASIRKDRDKLGADGALLRNEAGEIYQVNFIEKILATVLAKLSNLIPEGGIWMNTQRPEWNDANNALVGNGVSMVTLYYLRRFLTFFETIINNQDGEGVQVSVELADFYKGVREIFEHNVHLLEGPINNKDRKVILDAVGTVASEFRSHVYDKSFWGKKRTISFNGLQSFTKASLQFIDHTIKANKREDNLYHAYNLMTVEDNNNVSIDYLSEMLEGQVAVLSSGILAPKEVLEVLDALKSSALFREDQYSYLLYPNKQLPGFFEKNNISEAQVQQSTLLQNLLAAGNSAIIEKDVNGSYHFNGNFKNADDLADAIDALDTPTTAKEKEQALDIFEEVFNHKAFTGRSGTFFGYEGLGSIYWHMVSKLQLAVMECCVQAIEENASEEVIGRLLEHYYEINAGIGVHKSPTLYGAFPTDPYSHTPGGKGAQQPGMTGQVKEDILSRFGELGVFIKDGCLHFNPCLLRKEEFLSERKVFKYVNISQELKSIDGEPGNLCFTFCQVPIIYEMGRENKVIVFLSNQKREEFDSLTLNAGLSQEIFTRSGNINSIKVIVNEALLK